MPSKLPAPIPLQTAQRWSTAVLTELQKHCTRIETAGSIRRGRPQCHDIDIVCIPLTHETKDLFGATQNQTNQVLEWARGYIQRAASLPPAGVGEETPRIISGGEKPGKQLILQLRKVQLDLWFATEKNFASRMLCRTGSMEHNQWLALRFTERNMHWFPYEGIATLDSLREHNITLHTHGAADKAVAAGLILPAGTEADLYGYAGLELIPPEHRELDWLAKNIDSGL